MSMQQPTRPSALRRYAPFLAIIVVLAIAGVAFALTQSDDDGDDDTSSGDVEAALTFDEAVDEGIDTDDWKDCDQDTGRVAIPYPFTPPCVQPVAEGDDNGGATAPGVTADSIKVVSYITDPDINAAVSGALGGVGVDTDAALTEDTVGAYVEILGEHYETYGRAIDLQFYRGTGTALDEVAARNDARRIIAMEPFAVIGGPTQSPAFSEELAAAGVVCIQTCALAPRAEFALENRPYIYSIGPLPEQAQTHAANFVGTQLAGKNAEFAGDQAMHDQERVFGYVAYNTNDGYYTPMIEQFVNQLRDEFDTEIVLQREFLLDLAVNAEEAQSFVAAMKDAGVTTVLFSGDPFMPQFLSQAATDQDYHPEWVIGSTVLVDTTALARGFDQEQWAHAMGISLPAARGEQEVQTDYLLHQWQFCEEPASNAYDTHAQRALLLVTGIHMAGPNLTPESFEAGWFKYPPSGGIPTDALVSRGEHDIWPDLDVGGSDDVTVIYWDPEATGTDETGQEGVGMYRYVNDGERIRPEGWGDDLELPLFDDSQSVTLVEDFSGENLLPEYESPCGGPAVAVPDGRDSSG